MVRVWFKLNGKLDSCKVNVATKKEARKLLKDALPSANIGIMEKINK